MINFGNLERIESTILKPSSGFSIKNIVTLGTTNMKGQRKDCLFERAYNSKKYSNYNTLGALSIETQDYLVFVYYDKDTKKRIEIYSSYQHIKRIRKAFNELYDIIEEYKDDIWIQNEEDYKDISLNSKYENVQFEINHLVGNSSMILIPDLFEGEDESYKPGVTIFFNNEDLYTTMELESFEGVCYFLDNFNLLDSSQNLFNFAYLEEITHSMNLKNVDHEHMETVYDDKSYGGQVNRKTKFKRKNQDE